MNSIKQALRNRRQAGRGKRMFWTLTATFVLVALVWWTSPGAAGRQRGRAYRAVDHGSFADLATELREQPAWIDRIGLTADQATALADRLEARAPAFEALESRQATLKERGAALFLSEALDGAALAAIQVEARQLAIDTVDESFILFAEVVEHLTPSQRATLAEHWRER